MDAHAMRLVCVRTADEQEAYKRILEDFFVKRDGKFYHKRCDEEINSFKNKSDKAKESASKRWNKNKDLKDANALQTNSDSDANDMLTKNHKPITINHKPNITTTPEGVSQDIWDSFVQQRKKSRAVITETVIDSIQKEANKAGWTLEMALAECAARGWRGFKAEWVKSDEEKQVKNTQSKTMQGIMLLQQEIDRVNNEGDNDV